MARDLQPLIIDLKIAAIEAAMKMQNFEGDAASGWESVFSDRTVSGLDANGDGGGAETGLSPHEEPFAAAMFDGIRSWVHDLTDPWLETRWGRRSPTCTTS